MAGALASLAQGTPGWKEARLGKVTASRMADLTARTKAGWGASRANYMGQLLAERLTGAPYEGYANAAMQHGSEAEPRARAAYAFLRDADVAEVGFVAHPSVPMSGCSPDGLVGAEGLLEIKCPSTATHIDTLLGAPVAERYVKQMAWQMACTGRAWCDFASFDPRLPAELQLKVVRFPRDGALISSLEADVRDFLAEAEEKIEALRGLTA